MNNSLTILTCLALMGCGGSGASFDDVRSPEFEQCSPGDLKSWVQHNMDDYYLFYDQVTVTNPDLYEGPEEFVRALRVAPYDKYSYVTDLSTNDAFFEEGKRFGFGMRIQRSDNQRLYFNLIEPLSPLGATVAERGDELLAINGVTPNSFSAEFIADALGEGDEQVTVRFTLGKSESNEPVDVTVTKSFYDVQTVLDVNVLQHNNYRVGYLNFLSFLETSKAELNDAFAELKDENIDELVLDLRHNSGGRISVAEQIGNLVAGAAVEGTIFSRFAFNDKYTTLNTEYPFFDREGALNLSRVYVLTSSNTCSASEMVINSLRPFIEVVTVGDTTCGKPYGTTSQEYCGKSMHALEVEFQNAAGVGGYFDGIAADCPVDENLNQTLGHPSENLLRTALIHLDTASCAMDFGTLARSENLENLAARSALQTSAAASKEAITPEHSGEGPELFDPSFDEIRTLLMK